MTVEVSEEVQKEIFKLIATPGIEIEDIVKKTKLDSETILNILSEEYLRCNLDHGKSLCCR